MSERQPKIVKKVRAYPFPVELKLVNGALPGQVVKLAPQGFLAEVHFSPLQPGDRLEITFELPALHHLVHEQGKVIKLYNSWTSSIAAGGASPSIEEEDPAAGAASHTPSPPVADSPASSSGPLVQLLEVHFQTLSYENKAAILHFLKKAGAIR